MDKKFSADENDNWRTRQVPIPYNEDSSLQVPPAQTNGTTYYYPNYNNFNLYYGYSDYTHSNSNSKPRQYKGTTFYSTVDVKPPTAQVKLEPVPPKTPVKIEPAPPKTKVRLAPAPKEKKKVDRDKSDNWRSTAAAVSSRVSPSYCHPDDRNNNNRKELFKPYLENTEIEKGIKEGLYYQGILRLTKNKDDAYITIDELDADVYIGGASKRNRALQGDLVAIRLLADVEKIWRTKKEKDAKRKHERNIKRLNEKGITTTGKNETPEPESDEEKEEFIPEYCGEVVGILLRLPDTTYPGHILAQKYQNKNDNVTQGQNNKIPKKLNFAWFKPTDKRVPFILLRNEDIPKDLLDNEEYYASHLFSASIRRWQITDSSPIGKINKELGPVGDLRAEKEALISDNNVIATDFSPLAIKSLPKLPWSIPEKEYQIRYDIRSKCIFSIDPSTAKDLDDALHIEQLEDGYFEVGVHIADVSYFLKKGSALDNEARARGTSTYLVDGVIPMLPSMLCEELCSLNPGVDRLAFSVIWKMDEEGNAIDTWFGKTIIRSCAKLAYDDAQSIIEGRDFSQNVEILDGHDRSVVANDILLLNSIAVNKRKKRYAEGSLSLNSVKLNFELDEYDEPIAVKQFEQKDANRLIEEFMLSANISVARRIAEAFPEEALLRRHEEPLSRRLREFLKLTDSLGLDFEGETAGDLQQSFDKISHKNVKEVLLVLAIRCMQRAKYFCAGVADISKYGHYALNEPLYTHFTSPIRRYADVIVHRMLEVAIQGKDDCGYEQKAIQRITFNCNSKKDGSRGAQDASNNLYLSKYLFNLEMSEGLPLYAEAVVINVSKESFEIYMPKFGLEKKIQLDSLPTESYEFDKITSTLDIFWTHGVPVSMHNEEQIYTRERVGNDDFSDEEEKEQEEEQEKENNLNIKTLKNDNELVLPVILDSITGLQRLKMFSSVNIRIQVNMTRSPPIINIYPVNPFSGEQVDRCI